MINNNFKIAKVIIKLKVLVRVKVKVKVIHIIIDQRHQKLHNQEN